MRIEFVIDELVLIGFDPRDRHRVADAVETQLAAQAAGVSAARLAERSHAPGATLCAPDIKLSARDGRVDANALGKDVSRSVVSAVVGGESAARKR
jgi:hypothetical protein